MTEISMAEAIQQFLQQRKLQSKVHALRITEVWTQLMGKIIAQYTNEIKIVGHTLYISTTIAPLKQELMYQRLLIIQRVNEALGEELIEEVVIQ
ncbi:MAG TPA: DUF721 domain-containing protein [Chitinophagaceae bacterium]|jgi:predicted nucleic acid-binding Zn ribbon protein|nr:DUF721 domain-containing protein [Chitinophagaceae bacterium]